MGLEVFGFYTDLVASNPLGSDGKNQGDDHIRGIKATIKAQWPNFTGEACTPTEAELNALAGGALSDQVAANTARLEGPIDGVLYAQRDGAWFAIDGFEENATEDAIGIALDQYIYLYTGTDAAPTAVLTEGAAIGRAIVVENWESGNNDLTITEGAGETFTHADGAGAVVISYGKAAHFLKTGAAAYRVII